MIPARPHNSVVTEKVDARAVGICFPSLCHYTGIGVKEVGAAVYRLKTVHHSAACAVPHSVRVKVSQFTVIVNVKPARQQLPARTVKIAGGVEVVIMRINLSKSGRHNTGIRVEIVAARS